MADGGRSSSFFPQEEDDDAALRKKRAAAKSKVTRALNALLKKLNEIQADRPESLQKYIDEAQEVFDLAESINDYVLARELNKEEEKDPTANAKAAEEWINKLFADFSHVMDKVDTFWSEVESYQKDVKEKKAQDEWVKLCQMSDDAGIEKPPPPSFHQPVRPSQARRTGGGEMSDLAAVATAAATAAVSAAAGGGRGLGDLGVLIGQNYNVEDHVSKFAGGEKGVLLYPTFLSQWQDVDKFLDGIKKSDSQKLNLLKKVLQG